MTEIPALYGQIELDSFASVTNSLVGITSEGETFATVRLGQDDPNWNITTQPSGYYLRFSIGEYPYTGIDGTTVVATSDSSQDVAWNSTYIDGAEAYVIYPADDSSVAWTVQDFDNFDSSAIVLQSRDDSSSSQWFKVIDN